jgi:hypothetical protein
MLMKNRNAQSREVSSDVVSLVIDGELIAVLKGAAESELACALAMAADEKDLD